MRRDSEKQFSFNQNFLQVEMFMCQNKVLFPPLSIYMRHMVVVFPFMHPLFVTLYHITIYYLDINDGGGLVAKSCPTLATPWTVPHQDLLSMKFSRQEYWSGLPFPSL